MKLFFSGLSQGDIPEAAGEALTTNQQQQQKKPTITTKRRKNDIVGWNS